MHDRPRKPLKEEDESALLAKAEKLRSLQSQFLANHQNRMYVLPLTLLFRLYFFCFDYNSINLFTNIANRL
jgi:hypothetical protein